MITKEKITILNILRWARDFLQKYDIPNSELDAQVLLGYTLGIKRFDLYLNLDTRINKYYLERYINLIKKRALRIPVAYLTGEKGFMGLNFLVNEDVLIPRPETEILTETVLSKTSEIRSQKSEARNHPPSSRLRRTGMSDEVCSSNQDRIIIVDIGTGSGNIAVSLAKFVPDSEVYAVDISGDALKIAKINAKMHMVNDRIYFIQTDMFNSLNRFNINNKVDFIVSNPPYIEKNLLDGGLQPEIYFEPRVALDGGKEGLDFYYDIISDAPYYLKENGYLIIEMGDGQALIIDKIIGNSDSLIKTEIIKDYSGIDRVMVAKKFARKTRMNTWGRL